MLETERQIIAVDAVHFVDGLGREIVARLERWEYGDGDSHDYAWLVTDDPTSYRNILAIYSDRRELGTWHFGH